MPTTGVLALDVLIVLGVVGGGLGGIAAIYRGVRWVVRQLRRVGWFLDDFHGQPARPGRSAKPGFMQRLDNIEGHLDGIEGRMRTVEGEISLNSGRSLKDAVRRIEVKLDTDHPRSNP